MTKLKYVAKIRQNLSIYSDRRTSHLLDGTYKSIHRGKSLDFDNLREYTKEDDVKDVDWKASARNGSLLVRNYVAEKKHYVMLVLDTGANMLGDTLANIQVVNDNRNKHVGATNNTANDEPADFSKRLVALYAGGTLGYLALKNGDYVAMCYGNGAKVELLPFRANLYILEHNLSQYDAAIPGGRSLEQVLNYLNRYIKERMIVVVISDVFNLNTISKGTLMRLQTVHDVMAVAINDAFLTAPNLLETYDLNSQAYLPNFLKRDSKLFRTERKLREEQMTKLQDNFKRLNIPLTTIDNLSDVSLKLISLLEQKKYVH